MTVIDGVAESQRHFELFIEKLASAVGHADRAEPLLAYCTGLLLPGERKSVEPMAARVAPSRVQSQHQSMHHFVADAPWDDAAILQVAQDHVLPVLRTKSGDLAWILDDSGMPKQGKHSVGIARQYCGQLGKRANCQVAVSLSVANDWGSLPIAYRLYLPKDWANDAARREKAKVPKEIKFATKPQIALVQLRGAIDAGISPGTVVADAGYGNDSGFREGVTALNLRYCVGIQTTTTVWRPGEVPLPPKPYQGRGQPPVRLRRSPEHQPIAVKDLALSLPSKSLRTVTWREGAKGPMKSRFAAVRVRPAHRDEERREPWPEEWLLIEWPCGEPEPTKYWLSTRSKYTSLRRLVAKAKIRWRIERDYEELKQELGLGHYEGRGWRGFHHHASLCIAAYAFLMREGLFFPHGPNHSRPQFQAHPVPECYRPRGSPDAT